MNDTMRQILEQMAAGRIPDDIPDTAEYADTLRRLAQYFAVIQRFTIALSNGDLSQSLEGVTGPVAGGLKSLQSGLQHLTWQTEQIAAGDFSQSVDFMGDFSSAFNTMVADLGAARGQLEQANQELSREIETRKRVEKELEFKNAILSTQQETSIDGILVVDENNTIISYNRKFADLWGIPYALLDARDDEPVLRFVKTRVADEEGFLTKVKYLYEHKEEKSREEIFLKDGRVFDRYSAPMLGSDEKYLGRVWYLRDITERKQAEIKIIQQNDFLNTVLESLPHPFYVLDAGDYTVKMANSTAAPASLLPNTACYVLTHKEASPCQGSSHICPLETIQRTGQPMIAEHLHYDRDGNTSHVEVHAHPIFDGSGNVIQIIEYTLDITERKSSEMERERLIGELQDALSKVKLLSGFLPICASCKNIRDDKGYWRQIEAYIRDHSEAEFSHGICPECAKKLYPEFYKEN